MDAWMQIFEETLKVGFGYDDVFTRRQCSNDVPLRILSTASYFENYPNH